MIQQQQKQILCQMEKGQFLKTKLTLQLVKMILNSHSFGLEILQWNLSTEICPRP